MLFGLFVGSDIVYVFTIGSTNILLSEVYSVFLFFILLLDKKVNLRMLNLYLPISAKTLGFLIIFSAVPAFITFLSVSSMYRYIVGLIALIFSLCALFSTIILYDGRRYIVIGLEMALIINAVFSVIQFIVFNRGETFILLYNMFPQASFHLSVYNFGAEGMFLEPSHLNQFIATVLPVWLVFRLKASPYSIFVLFAVIITTAMTTSGTSVVVYVGLIMYALICFLRKENKRYIKRKTFYLMSFVICAGILIIIILLQKTDLISTFQHFINLAFEGSNIADESNIERTTSMQAALALIPKNLLGCGWNMVHTLLEQNTNLNVATAFSDIIEMTLELGILGITVYVLFIYKLIKRCLLSKETEGIGLAVSVVSIFVMQLLADYAFCPVMFMVFGWCIAYSKKQVIIS